VTSWHDELRIVSPNPGRPSEEKLAFCKKLGADDTIGAVLVAIGKRQATSQLCRNRRAAPDVTRT